MTSTKTLLTALTATAAFAAGSAQAATITTGATWPGSPAAETVDAHSYTTGGRNITGARQIRQTFQTATDINLEQIILSASNYSSVAFTIKIFEVTDIEGSNWGTTVGVGSQVGSTITVDAGTAAGGTQNLAVTLTLAEQFLLAARNTGTQGYGMEIESVGTAAAFEWRHANVIIAGSDPVAYNDYAPGRYYNEGGSAQNLSWDMGLALIGPVPEPGSLALLGLGGLLIARRRRD